MTTTKDALPVYVRLKRPDGYEDVHPQLLIEDANINPAFEPEDVTAEIAALASKQAPAEPTETMYLVHAGGDAYQAEIVPESRLDDAYLLTQWCTLEDIAADERARALEHFHDDDSWTHEEVTGHGKRVKFSVDLEDGWIEVVRLPDSRPAEAQAKPEPAASDRDATAELTDAQLDAAINAWFTPIADSYDDFRDRMRAAIAATQEQKP